MHRHDGKIAVKMREALSALREWWRGASGTHAYDCYLNHVQKDRTKPLTPQEFYLDDIERKYSRANRCC